MSSSFCPFLYASAKTDTCFWIWDHTRERSPAVEAILEIHPSSEGRPRCRPHKHFNQYHWLLTGHRVGKVEGNEHYCRKPKTYSFWTYSQTKTVRSTSFMSLTVWISWKGNYQSIVAISGNCWEESLGITLCGRNNGGNSIQKISGDYRHELLVKLTAACRWRWSISTSSPWRNFRESWTGHPSAWRQNNQVLKVSSCGGASSFRVLIENMRRLRIWIWKSTNQRVLQRWWTVARN